MARGRGIRLVGLLPVAAVALVLLGSSLAWGVGELTQKPGKAGCLNILEPEVCAPASFIGGATGLAISPDGRNAYVIASGSDTLATLDRDPATGELTSKPGEMNCLGQKVQDCTPGKGLDKPEGIAISPDGTSVYVASQDADAVAILRRDPSTGILTQPEGKAGCIGTVGSGECENAGNMTAGASDVALSPDGRNVYMVGTGEGGDIAALDRDPASGNLTPKPGKAACISVTGMGCQQGRAFASPEAVVVSPDGTSVYLADSVNQAVLTFKRDPATGALLQAEDASSCLSTAGPTAKDPCQQGRGLLGPRDIAISPDGKSVYAVGGGRLAIFDRGPGGELTQKPGAAACFSMDGADGIGGPCQADPVLNNAEAVTISPDGRSVYVTSLSFSSFVAFDRHLDGTLTPQPKPGGCFTLTGSNGACQAGRGIEGAAGVVVGPEGRSVYVAASFSGGVAIFDRVPPDTLAPTVSGFRLAPTRFGAKPKGHGSSFQFRLSEPATVKIVVERPRGRKRFTAMVKVTKALGRAGAARIPFSGRGKRKPLKPGAYRATVVATDAEGNASQPRRARFKILAPRPRRR